MSLRVRLRETDRERTYRLVQAWASNDEATVRTVIDEAHADPEGMLGLLLGVTTFADWACSVSPDLPAEDASGIDDWLADLTRPDDPDPDDGT